MPDSYNTTQIPAPRVPLIDARTGLMAREWYMFFINIYTLTGEGRNVLSLTDVQLGPSDSALTTTAAEYDKIFQALESAPALENLYSEQYSLEGKISDFAQSPSQDALYSLVSNLSSDINALELAPANTPQVPDMRYGVFYDTTTQTAAAVNTAYAVTFNTTELSNGVYIGSPTSRVYVDRPGIYNFQFSAQLDHAGANAQIVWIWADINGVTQANTATKVTLVGNSAAAVAAWNFVFNMNAGDYFRLMWAVDNTSCQLTAEAAVAPVPAIPSVILTVTDNIGVKR